MSSSGHPPGKGGDHPSRCIRVESVQKVEFMSSWQPITTVPKNDDRVLVAGGNWIRGNRQRLPQTFPCLVIWDETECLICDNEGPRSVIHGPKYWMPIPPAD